MGTHSREIRDRECTLFQLYMNLRYENTPRRARELNHRARGIQFHSMKHIFVHYRLTWGRYQTQNRNKARGEMRREMFDGSLKYGNICIIKMDKGPLLKICENWKNRKCCTVQSMLNFNTQYTNQYKILGFPKEYCFEHDTVYFKVWAIKWYVNIVIQCI